jgi:predicted nucleic acid-binding protein
MNLADSSGRLEYFIQGGNAGLFAPAIRDTNSLVVLTVCMYEVFKRMLVQRGEEDALQAIGVMSLGIISDPTQEIAINAAQISSELKIAMGDSMILATARKYHTVLWTQDRDFEGLIGVKYFPKYPVFAQISGNLLKIRVVEHELRTHCTENAFFALRG